MPFFQASFLSFSPVPLELKMFNSPMAESFESQLDKQSCTFQLY